jgi:hypothetical protein
VQASNLLSNSDFDRGLTVWNTFTYVASIDSTDGSPSVPAMQISTTPFFMAPGSFFDFWSECVPLAGSPPPWEYGMRVRVVSAGSSCHMDISASFDTGTCAKQGTNFGSAAFAVGTVSGVQGDFTQYAATTNDPRPGGGTSRVVRLIALGICDGAGEAMTINVDHAYFGTAGTTPVRLQSFDVE